MRNPLVIIVALCMLASRASAEPPRRVALVIGNSAYVAAPQLANPGADARLIAEALRHAGFTNVDLQIDLSKPRFERALQEFQKRADSAEVALVYYAGHGLEVDGRNWLVPVDAMLEDERDLPFQAIDLDVVLGTVTHAKDLSIVVLDACRDNPFTRSIRRTSGTRGLASRGLAAIEVTGTLVLYAQRAGQTALDGVGSDSPFAIALAKRLPEPGVDVRILVSKVRDDVLAMTGGKQEPFSYGSLPGVQLELVPGLSAPAPSTVDSDLEAFNKAATLNTTAGWDAYLRTYPQGRYSSVAKTERDALAQQPSQAAIPAPKVSTQMHVSQEVAAPAPIAASSVVSEIESRLVSIPAGRFAMGDSNALWKATYVHVKPDHSVSVRAFKLSAYDVTFDQYDVFARATGHELPDDAGWGRGNNPVINVNWDDAQAFIAWLNQKSAKRFRLPSEAEWEYAARAGTTTSFYWGKEFDASLANRNGSRTSPVGSFSPNAWGLYDMSGNVSQWTQDCWNESYGGAPTDGSAWISGDCTFRMYRGGSWRSPDPEHLRVSYRFRYPSTGRTVDLGFRLAQDP
jgi:formylglycine-generating enzyme required for sulfatase activity